MKFDGRKFHRDTRGQSLVEFALVLPMLLVVMLMITEFGRALYQYNVLSQAARAGARVAAVSGSAGAQAAGIARAQQMITDSNGFGDDNVTITSGVTPNYLGSGRSVVWVQASMPFRFMFSGPLPANADGSAQVTPGALTLTARNTMHAELFN
jgi:hypothetical protein